MTATAKSLKPALSSVKLHVVAYMILGAAALWMFARPGTLIGPLTARSLLLPSSGSKPSKGANTPAKAPTANASLGVDSISRVDDRGSSSSKSGSDNKSIGADSSSSRGGGDGPSGVLASNNSSTGGGSTHDIFSAPTSLHGPQTKAGPLDPRQWLQAYATRRHSLYFAWLKQHEQEHPFGGPPSRKLPDPQPTAFPMCQVWVNHAYRVLYLRHAKTGSTSVRYWFGCGKGACSPLERLEPTLSEAQAERLFNEYFVFSAVRNPYARALSTYKHMRRTSFARPECVNLTSWDSFCAFPPVMGLAARHAPACSVVSEGFSYIHMVPQAACMLTQQGGLAADYVIRADMLDEEAGGLFREINKRRPKGLPPLKVPSPNKNSQLNAAAKTCEQGSTQKAESYLWEGKVHATLAPHAHEQHCETADYFGAQHPRCLAQLNSFLAPDLRLLMGQGGGGAGADVARCRGQQC